MRKILSIITVVRNDKTGLINTYKSIESSLSEEVEWIVIDGLSSDGSQDFLKTLNCEYLKWSSETDRNMYDAMNKGVKMANGEYLQFLNAGDILVKSLRKTFLIEQNNTDLIFYNIDKFDVNQRRINWSLPKDFLEHLEKYPSVPHQSTFIKKSVFDKLGLYCEDYKYLGDYDFFCRVFYNTTFKPTYAFHLDTNLVSFICNGVTFNYKLSLKLMDECAQIQKVYFNKVDQKTKFMYISKYILSYFPGTLKIASFMRKYIKH